MRGIAAAILFIVFLTGQAIGYTIEAYLFTNEVRKSQQIKFIIESRWSKDESCAFDFPTELNFPNLKVLSVNQESFREMRFDNDVSVHTNQDDSTQSLIDTGLADEIRGLRYTYILSAETNGQLFIPSTAVGIRDSADSSEDFFRTPSMNVLVIQDPPPGKGWFSVVLTIVTVCAAAAGFYRIVMWAAKNRRNKDITYKKNLQLKYYTFITEENNLKFMPDKKDYLLFLINHFRNYFRECRDKNDINKLRQLYESCGKIANTIKFKGKVNNDIIERCVAEIESVFHGYY